MKIPPLDSMTRREAMRLLGVGAAGYSLGGYTASAQGFPKNEAINLGLIGCGGRMNGALLRGLQPINGVQVVAVCDVHDARVDSAHARVGGRDRDVFRTRDHRAVLDRADVDAVIVATPDHLHVPITLDAIDAAKDVYIEKPLTHSLEEGSRIIKAKQKSDRVIQVGAQQRTMPHLIVLRDKLQSGEIDPGEINRVYMQWCGNIMPYRKPNFRISEDEVDWQRFLGNAPKQPFDPFRMKEWRWFWDFGNGKLGDLMVHWVDTMNWLLDLPMPAQVLASGGHYGVERDWETPDAIHCLMEYPDRHLQMNFVSSVSNNYGGAAVAIMGSKATIHWDRSQYIVLPQNSNDRSEANMRLGDVPAGGNFKPGYESETLHLSDWLAAMRERRDPANPVEAGVQSAAVSHHGNISYLEKRFVQL